MGTVSTMNKVNQLDLKVMEITESAVTTLDMRVPVLKDFAYRKFIEGNFDSLCISGKHYQVRLADEQVIIVTPAQTIH